MKFDERTRDEFGRRVTQGPLERRVDAREPRGATLAHAHEQQIGRDGEESFQLPAAGLQLCGDAFPIARCGQQRLQRRHHSMHTPHRGDRNVFLYQQRSGVLGSVAQTDRHLIAARVGATDRQGRVGQPEDVGQALPRVVESRTQCGCPQHHARQIRGQIGLQAPLLGFGSAQPGLSHKAIGQERQSQEYREGGCEAVSTLEMEIGVHGGAGQ